MTGARGLRDARLHLPRLTRKRRLEPPFGQRVGKPQQRRYQAENDEPQPQVDVAFGFLITNCAPSMPSV